MRVARMLLLKFRALCFRTRVDADAAEELRLHLDREVSRYLAAGLPPEAARRTATVETGNPAALAEASRDTRGLAWLDALRLDLRHTLRRWRRRPAFVATLVLILATGIGTTTALFSVIDAVLLRPLPWPAADRLVAIHAVVPERLRTPALAATWNRAPISWLNWQRLARTPTFEQIGVFYAVSYERYDTPGRMASVLFVSSSFLPMLGVHPVIGRHLMDAEDFGDTTERSAPARIEDITPPPPKAVLISHAIWQAEFQARADVIGRLVGLAASTYTVVGVLPQGFEFGGERPDFVLPIGIMEHNSQYTDLIHAIARISPEVSFEAASTAAELIVRGDKPAEERTARVVSLLEDQVGYAVRPLWMLFGGATLLLLVACSTVAGLLLGDAGGRRHEMAVRASLGGGGTRILRQLAVEHVLLATAAGSAGLLAANWLTRGLVALAPGALPRLDTVTVDTSVGLLALGLGGTTVLLFGLAPVLPLAWTPAREVLADGTRGGSPRGHRGQRVVVAVQIAVALVLLVGASLFGETMFRLTSRPLGFDPSNLAILSFTWSRNPAVQGDRRVSAESASRGLAERAALARADAMRQTAERNIGGLDAILANLRAVPGVTAAAASTHVPFVGSPAEGLVRPDGQVEAANHQVRRQFVTPDYFRAMRIPMLRGRPFVGAETQGVVVSRELERQLFGGDALDRGLIVEGAAKGTYKVIGIVEDVRHGEFAANGQPTIYLSNALGTTVRHVLVRSASDAGRLLPRLLEGASQSDARMIVIGTGTMEALISESVAEERLRATLSSLFGAGALVMAALGLYSLAARLVVDRRREIGVRVALGARPVHVRTLVVRDGLRMVAGGVALGLPAAFAASEFMRSLLFGVSPTAPHVFLTAVAVLVVTAILATVIPAQRASRTHPADVLRES